MRLTDPRVLTTLVLGMLFTGVFAFAVYTASLDDSVFQAPTIKADAFYVGGQTLAQYITATAPGSTVITQASAYSWIVSKVGSDYYANSTTGAADITSASFSTVLNQLSNGIYVKVGSYTVDAVINVDTAGTIIKGESRTGVVLTADGSFTATDPMFYISTSSNHLESMTLDMSDEGDNCIEIYNGNSNFIMDLTITNVVQDGIYMSASAERNSNRILDCSITQPGRYGVNIGANVGHTWIERVVISDTTTSTKVVDAGIYISSSEGQNKIADCAIWGCMRAIQLSGAAYRFTITNNFMTDNWIGIEINASNGDIKITDNTFWYTGRAEPSPTDENSDIYFNTANTQYGVVIGGNNSNGQSAATHFIFCTDSNKLTSAVMDGNAVLGMTGTEYAQGTQSGLVVGDNT